MEEAHPEGLAYLSSFLQRLLARHHQHEAPEWISVEGLRKGHFQYNFLNLTSCPTVPES